MLVYIWNNTAHILIISVIYNVRLKTLLLNINIVFKEKSRIPSSYMLLIDILPFMSKDGVRMDVPRYLRKLLEVMDNDNILY